MCHFSSIPLTTRNHRRTLLSVSPSMRSIRSHVRYSASVIYSRSVPSAVTVFVRYCVVRYYIVRYYVVRYSVCRYSFLPVCLFYVSYSCVRSTGVSVSTPRVPPRLFRLLSRFGFLSSDFTPFVGSLAPREWAHLWTRRAHLLGAEMCIRGCTCMSLYVSTHPVCRPDCFDCDTASPRDAPMDIT